MAEHAVLDDEHGHRRCAVFQEESIMPHTETDALKVLDNRDVFYVFPAKNSRTTTVLVLETPKTDGSSRKVFLP